MKEVQTTVYEANDGSRHNDPYNALKVDFSIEVLGIVRKFYGYNIGEMDIVRALMEYKNELRIIFALYDRVLTKLNIVKIGIDDHSNHGPLVEEGEIKCNYITCSAGMGVAGMGRCHLGGDPRIADCKVFNEAE